MRIILTIAFVFFLNTSVYSQAGNDILENITLKFQTFCKTYPREEVYVQTDRDVYIAGEDVFFQVFLFDRQNESLTSSSRISYLEILNQENRPVAQVKAGLNNGVGSGQVLLPDTISPGVYTLRAYTNWMKNFMPSNCYCRKIKVFGNKDDKNFDHPIEPGNNSTGVVSDLQGIVSQLNTKAGRGLEAVLITNPDFRVKNNEACYMFIETHGVINFKSAITLTGDTTRYAIPSSKIIPGINHLTVFNSSGKPVSESYSYTRRGDLYSVHINVSGPDTIRTRSKIPVNLEYSEQFSTDDSLVLNISAVPEGTRILNRIDDYLVFGSEFGQLPDSLIDIPLDEIPETIMKKLLSTLKSNWIDWNTILSVDQYNIKYQKESQYHFLYGTVFNKTASDTAFNYPVFMSVPGENASLQYSSTDRDRSFCFSLPIDDKTRDLIIQTVKKGNNEKIIIEPDFSERYPIVSHQKLTETSLPTIVQKLTVNKRVMNIYKTFEAKVPLVQENVSRGAIRFYGKPDIELIMKDFIKLPTMQEVFFELLPGVSIKSENPGYKVLIRDPLFQGTNDDPLLLIDGVVISDASLIYNLDPELVKKIDVIKSRFVLGDYIFTGLVNVITYKGTFDNIKLPEDAVRLTYRDYMPPAKFKIPDYSTTESLQSHIPDFRNTLYWNILNTSAKEGRGSIDFFSSDFIGDYDIIIQGVTRKGRFISERKPLNIQK